MEPWAVEDFEDLRVGDLSKAAVGEDRADGFAVGSGAALEGVDDGEGGLPSRRSLATGLPRTSSGGGEGRGRSSTIWKARPRLRP